MLVEEGICQAHNSRCPVPHQSVQRGALENFDPDCPRVMIVPVIKPVNSKEVEIRGSLPFPEGVQGQEMKTM